MQLFTYVGMSEPVEIPADTKKRRRDAQTELTPEQVKDSIMLIANVLYKQFMKTLRKTAGLDGAQALLYLQDLVGVSRVLEKMQEVTLETFMKVNGLVDASEDEAQDDDDDDDEEENDTSEDQDEENEEEEVEEEDTEESQ